MYDIHRNNDICFLLFGHVPPYLNRPQNEIAMLPLPLAEFDCEIFNLSYRVQTSVDEKFVVVCALSGNGKNGVSHKYYNLQWDVSLVEKDKKIRPEIDQNTAQP